MQNGKIQYSLKVLEDQLSKNVRELEFWKSNLSSGDAMVVRQANGNIGSCETRIADLKAGIAQLTVTSKTEEKPAPEEKPKEKEKKVERIRLNFKSVGKRYGNNIRAIQTHIGDNEDAIISAMEKDAKYEFVIPGETPLPVTLEPADLQIQ